MSRATAVLTAVLAAFVVLPAPGRAAPPDLPRAKAAILIDAADGAVIASKDARRRRPMASTTKLMTALLVLERAKLTDVFTAPAYRALPIESKIDLRKGERMTVADLLRALLLESANDAAVTLAEGVSGSRAAFVAEMNARAAELGLRDTGYANSIGLDDPANYSSARDLALLARRALRNREFARIVDLPSATLTSGSRTRIVRNRNGLIARHDFVDGVKTGRTSGAGYVLVGAASSDLGTGVISVVMGEPSEAARDADTLALLRYGLSRFRRVRALRATRELASAAVAYRDERARLVPRQDLFVVARQGQKVTTRVSAPRELRGELPAGARVGSVRVLVGGRVVERVPLVTAETVPGAGVVRRVADSVGVLTLVLLLAMVSGALMLGTRNRRGRRHEERIRRRRARADAWAAASEDGEPAPRDTGDDR